MKQAWPLAFCFAVIVFSGVGAAAYTRPPPGRILAVKRSGSDSHPQQVRISIVGSDHMLISWITKDKNIPSLVEYGKTRGVYDSSASGESTSYRFFFYTSGNIHHVEIGPLDANTTYYYRCGGVGGEFTFKTPPSTLPIEFVLIGDLGQTEWTASTLSHINYSDYDILLLPGDLSYADSQQPLWDSFALLVQPQASRRPWMVTQGNHEVESLFPIFRIHPFAAYNARWRMPFEQSSSTSNLFYSFDAAGGEAHVLMLGSYAEYGVKSQQYKWLKVDLAKLDRRKTPWLLAIVHAPWYNTNDAHQREGEGMRKDVEKLLFDAKVDIVFAGHVHAYERFTRIYDNAANPCGPIYITIGDGGNREGLAYNFNEEHNSANLSVFREASFGHGRLKVLDKKRAHWTWHRNDNSNLDVGDELWIESLSSSASCMTFKPPIHSVQTIGMIGSLSGASRMRASGIQHQQRLGQPTDKSLPQSATNQTLNTSKFPNPGLSRPTSMPSPNVPISVPQSAQSLQQQWMSNQGKQTHGTSFPSTAYRPHTKQQYSPPVAPNQPQVLPSQQQQQQQQQKQHQQQHHHQQQQNISTHHLQDLHSNRNQQSLPQLHQQAAKGASITQRLNNQLGQPDLGHSGSAIPVTEDTPETGDQILSKRSIQELVAQIDPYEKLEPEVEDVLVEIADDFVESITTAACLLAKHRRSTALEAKDILLYVERNWNMTLPGFGGDDIKLYKKPYTTDIHKERLAMIRKSAGIASDMGTAKNVAAGQVAANSKAQAIKTSAPSFTSPKGS